MLSVWRRKGSAWILQEKWPYWNAVLKAMEAEEILHVLISDAISSAFVQDSSPLNFSTASSSSSSLSEPSSPEEWEENYVVRLSIVPGRVVWHLDWGPIGHHQTELAGWGVPEWWGFFQVFCFSFKLFANPSNIMKRTKGLHLSKPKQVEVGKTRKRTESSQERYPLTHRPARSKSIPDLGLLFVLHPRRSGGLRGQTGQQEAL